MIAIVVQISTTDKGTVNITFQGEGDGTETPAEQALANAIMDAIDKAGRTAAESIAKPALTDEEVRRN